MALCTTFVGIVQIIIGRFATDGMKFCYFFRFEFGVCDIFCYGDCVDCCLGCKDWVFVL